MSSADASQAAVFVDLDRTLLRGASGPYIDAALRAVGLMEGRPNIPASSLSYRFYDLVGENLPFMVLVRLASRFVKGWDVAAFEKAGAEAASALEGLVQPYARTVLAEHRQEGRLLVLATTTPSDLVAPLAERLGFDDVIATRYRRSDGRLSGGIDGDFVWGPGKLAAVRRWSAANGVDLRASHAYSDSFFDVPLLRSVGHPHTLNPDVRLRTVAVARRWPIEHWDRPAGVPKLVGVEPYHLLRPFVRPELIPYARFDIAGTEHVPSSGPVVLASNHRSYFDVVALALVAAKLGRPVRFLGKKELFDAPVIGQVARAIGGIPVDRGGETSSALRQATAALDAGEVVVILPQGTIPRGQAFFDPVLKGKTGVARLAAATGAVVVPIGLWGTEQVWPRSARLPAMNQLQHPPLVQIRMGRPLQLADRDAVAETARVMKAIASLLPPEARKHRVPTPEELVRTYPPGKAATD